MFWHEIDEQEAEEERQSLKERLDAALGRETEKAYPKTPPPKTTRPKKRKLQPRGTRGMGSK
jgi:hypothetical protein